MGTKENYISENTHTHTHKSDMQINTNLHERERVLTIYSVSFPRSQPLLQLDS